MVVQVVEELAVLGAPLLEPGAVVVTELAQRILNGDRLDLTHVDKRTERLPRGLAVPYAVPAGGARRPPSQNPR